ncbi:hypothetical protein ND00_21890 [Clostridium sp. L74]|nr:hypothetical protein ND00_21890 [Clostridium sp. L74]
MKRVTGLSMTRGLIPCTLNMKRGENLVRFTHLIHDLKER